ncbi:hypothetical protein JTE90_025936 [Oedothorax gibbosus]|uniref:Sodium/potassium-transporting ATPase subunit beta n=1 Tax=Oedothorax gibbosus TaxID=931172 RepID=A0AAV6UBJ7_9ARAC|nr:hypothetical protein JTE90_025936 [Oedothorax gibbosus]
MAYSKSYSVNSKVRLPQPHVEYGSSSTSGHSWTVWFLFSLLGAGAVTLILCINFLGGKKLLLNPVDPTAGLVPIVHQGELEVHPLFQGSNNGIESRFFSNLKSNNLTEIQNSLSHLFDSYPKEHGQTYTNCWLENPNSEKPCFFDSSWVTDLCTSEDSYGYGEHDGQFNPCFVMKLERTKDWVPRLNENREKYHDHGFTPIHCSLKVSKNSNASLGVFPSKGFSRLFFPVSRFNESTYLPPLVAVKVNGIGNGDTVRVQCYVVTPNAFILRNNGRVSITFSTG